MVGVGNALVGAGLWGGERGLGLLEGKGSNQSTSGSGTGEETILNLGSRMRRRIMGLADTVLGVVYRSNNCGKGGGIVRCFKEEVKERCAYGPSKMSV